MLILYHAMLGTSSHNINHVDEVAALRNHGCRSSSAGHPSFPRGFIDGTILYHLGVFYFQYVFSFFHFCPNINVHIQYIITFHRGLKKACIAHFSSRRPTFLLFCQIGLLTITPIHIVMTCLNSICFSEKWLFENV